MKFLTILCLAFPVLAFSQDSLSNHYKIYSTARQKPISLDDIANDMSTADVLFFGEEHNDSTGHYLEYALFKRLAKKYPQKIALSMEMFETDCQNVLNEYLSGFIQEKNMITDARAWHNYKDYRPLIELAKSDSIPVVAANAPRRYVNMVNRSALVGLTGLNDISKSYLPPLPIDTATGAYYEKFLQIMGGHAQMGGMHMFQSQNLWDATMGWSIARFSKKHKDYKVFHVNGSFHSEGKLGAAAQLKKYAPKLRILNIAVYCDESYDNPDWTKLSKNGDYIIVTDPKLPKTF
ncbi:MAG TPA: ChaN family lipoprotein [Mucilaginibacter sp.]|jgi:uncharacterized iron-regulated protein|nr:ChaN family lipoprotein [Mucilaginibacter sp.]